MHTLTKQQSLAQLAIAILAGAYVCHHVFGFYEGFEHRADFLYWDPAAHAFYGVKLTAALQSLNPLRVFSVINEQVLWPPLHSILQAPIMILMGKNFLASSTCSFLFLFLFYPALIFCYQQISGSWSGFLVLLSLATTSPLLMGFGSMPMLEIFGATLTVLSAALYLKGSRWFPLSLTALFFLKYNYCLYILLAFGAIEFVPRVFRLPKRSFSAFQIFVALYVAFIMMILLTGGFKIGKLSVRGIGNLLYILYLILLGRILIKKKYVSIWQQLKGNGWLWFVLPVAIWLLIPVPNRVKTLVNFAINAPLSGYSPGQLAYYTFYFQHLADYFSSPIVLLICAALGAICLAFNFRDKRFQFLAALFLLPFLLMTINQNKQERYLFTFIFSLWMLAALAIASLRSTVLALLCFCILAAAAYVTYDSARTAETVSWPFVPISVEPPLNFIAEELVNAKHIVVIGVSNEMSPALISYHVWKRQGFRDWPRFESELHRQQEPGTHVILIGQQPITNDLELVKRKSFPGNFEIQHFIMPN